MQDLLQKGGIPAFQLDGGIHETAKVLERHWVTPVRIRNIPLAGTDGLGPAKGLTAMSITGAVL
jgi:hypothetical protein